MAKKLSEEKIDDLFTDVIRERMTDDQFWN